MKKASKLFLIAVLAVAVLALAAPSTVFADTGPKPSVNITFKNVGTEEVWCTLLSQYESTGPYSVWDGDVENIYGSFENSDEASMSVFYAFADYQDADGFYFLQVASQINETGAFVWGYYPPTTFKILLYYPQSGTFVSSGVCEAYAFNSYYEVDLASVAIGETQPLQPAGELQPKRNYDYLSEILGLLARLVLTVAIEMAVAWAFRFKGKRAWLTILFTNTGTQLLLNIVLNVVNYRSGALLMYITYILAEFVVAVSEAIIYSFALKKCEPKVSVGISVAYAVIANLISFLCGWTLAMLVPALF